MMPAFDVGRLAWSTTSAHDAVLALAHAAGFAARPAAAPKSTAPMAPMDAKPTVLSEEGLEEGFVDEAFALGLDAEPVDVPASALLATLRSAAPLVLRLPADVAGADRLLLILRSNSRTTTVVASGGVVRVSSRAIENSLWSPLESTGDQQASSILRQIDVIPARRRAAACRVLRAPGLAGRPLATGWILRPLIDDLGDSLRGAKIRRRFAAVVALYLLQIALFVALWHQVGARALGHAAAAPPPPSELSAQGWGAFLALLGTWVVVQLAASAAVSRLALDAGAVVRAGLMRGALRLDPERIRTAGVGQLLGRAMDADVLDSLALGGGAEATTGIFELALGTVVLALGLAPFFSLPILGLVLAGVVGAARVHARRLSRWSRTRRELTHDLVERMIGHRTVLIQDRPTARAQADGRALDGYDVDTRALDRAEVILAVGLPRAWLLIALISMAASGALAAGALAATEVAVSLGGIWLVYGALRRLGLALPTLSLAREAWGQIAPLVGRPEGRAPGDGARVPASHGGDDTRVAPLPDGGPGASIVEVDNVGYRYPGRPAFVLDGATLAISGGDRILIEGASGGGKSTLAALLTGLKVPSTGTLRLRAIDQRSIGIDRWRRAVGGAPQFHDNHVIGADLLFNLLMGRRWPPRIEDVAAAERVCRDLGLGPLLSRMPAGLQQLVGETGWQLSHGERSRLFIARSLLQALEVRVLDESFASLDPSTLDEVMAAVLARREALVVIAHP